MTHSELYTRIATADDSAEWLDDELDSLAKVEVLAMIGAGSANQVLPDPAALLTYRDVRHFLATA